MLTAKEKRAGHDAAHRASGLTQTVGRIAPPCGPPIGGRPLRQSAPPIDGESHVPVRYPG